MQPFTTLRSRILALPEAHIDTDRIIPARFLTTTTSDGLGRHAFADWRRMREGVERPGCPLNDPRAPGAAIIVAGHNFGCGSSREHAAWALADLGVRAIISTEIADIFRANASRNGILPIVAAPEHVHAMLDAPFAEAEIDLSRREVWPSGGHALFAPFRFTIDPFTRRCLLDGVDHLGYLVAQLPRILASERREAMKAGCSTPVHNP
ncbi:MAG: 3-isopropylmalate dehydratase small subunit [Phycisphaerales bacterium]|nr:3-isopropylmalate dehydratase small subunit [Phycisphaerales bacterium]